jgi:hypothetical protein
MVLLTRIAQSKVRAQCVMNDLAVGGQVIPTDLIIDLERSPISGENRTRDLHGSEPYSEVIRVAILSW